MNKRSDKADEFLRAMQLDATETTSTPAPPRPADPAPAAPAQSQKPAKSRVDRKHIGGYLDRETVEKVAVLRARLSLDNSELIKLAIEELHRKHMAKRSFGDA